MCYILNMQIYYYLTHDGVDVFSTWLASLKDMQAYARITRRLMLLKRGGFGDCKPLRGGVWELRLDYGPGYRVYYGMTGKEIVLLLCGGDKRTQSRDIETAIAYFDDYKWRS